MKATTEQIEFARVKLLNLEHMLEDVGVDISDYDGSIIPHSHLGTAISEVQKSINSLYEMQ